MNAADRKPEDQGSILGAGDQPGPKDETIAALETKAQQLQERLTEERFLWILACIVLFDVLAFIHMTNWAGAIVIGVIQLIGLVVLGDKLRVNIVLPLIDRLTGYIPKSKSD